MPDRSRWLHSTVLRAVAAGAVLLTPSALVGLGRALPAGAACSGCWSQQAPLVAPSPRWAAAAALDPARGVVVVFGGLDPHGRSDTWEYSHGTWVQLHPRTSPPARGGAALAWDGRELVLFGGVPSYGSFAYLDDTWTWDGVTWTERHPTRRPAARTTSAGYDGRQAVLFGGAGQGPGYGGTYDDTWTWDAERSDWSQQPVRTSPSSRGPALMTYSAALHGAALQGGMSAVAHNDTWLFRDGVWTALSPDLGCGVPAPTAGLAETTTGDLVQLTAGRSAEPSQTFAWDGSHWDRQRTAPGPGPGPRLAPVMVGLPDSGILLFGGQVSGRGVAAEGQPLGDTWTWTGPAQRGDPVGTSCTAGAPGGGGGSDAVFIDGRGERSPTPGPPVQPTAGLGHVPGQRGGAGGAPAPAAAQPTPLPLPSGTAAPATPPPARSMSGVPSRRHDPGLALEALAAGLVLLSAVGAWRARH